MRRARQAAALVAMKVLVVEDQAAVAQALCERLKRLGIGLRRD
jgi:hypothetical protein